MGRILEDVLAVICSVISVYMLQHGEPVAAGAWMVASATFLKTTAITFTLENKNAADDE